MQVIFVSPHSDPEAALGEPDSGGQCVYEYQLAQALSQMPNTRVDVVCRQTYRRPAVTEINPNYAIHRIECGPRTFVPKEKIEPYLSEFAARVTTLFKPRQKKILHSHYWDGGKAGLLLKRLSSARLPMIWTPHSLGSRKRQNFTGRPNEQFYNFIPRLCWENYSSFIADQVVVSSAEEKQDVVSGYGIEPEKIEIIAPGVELDQFSPEAMQTARRKHQLPQTGALLLTLGRLTPSKGYHHAIRALAALKQIYAQPVRLVICAGSTQLKSQEEQLYQAALKNLAQELDVADSVIFMPAVAHQRIHEVYSAANVVLVFSEHEPFGLTVIESMAVRRPVVAANAGGPSSIIKHNQTGVLVNVHQPDRAAYYIQSLLKDPQLVERMTEAAHAYVVDTYDWRVKARAFRKLYRRALTTHQDRLQLWTRENYFLQHNLDYAVLH